MADQKSANWRLISMPLYLAFLAIIWGGQALWAADWLVSSRTGLQTLVQTLPAALIALFALAFATFFVAVQQVASVFSSRAPLILAGDIRVRRIVLRTIIITAASLVLGAVIPDSAKLPSYITSAGATLLIASAWLVYSYGRFAYVLILEYSSPRSFVQHVVEPTVNMLRRKSVKTGLIVFRVPLLGQTLRYALSREDIETFHASLEGLQRLQSLYVQASTQQPLLRDHVLDDGTKRTGWLADELRRIYTGACEEALRLSFPQEEIDLLVDYFRDATETFVKAHQQAEAKQMMQGLIKIATSPYQVTSTATNMLTRPASALALIEKVAEDVDEPEIATYALVAWAVAVYYPYVHFSRPHPLFDEGVSFLGSNPPWDRAIELARDPKWKSQWINQLGNRVDSLDELLQVAHDKHSGSGPPPGGSNATK